MRKSVAFREQRDGRLVVDHRFIAEGRRSRSIYGYPDDEAMACSYEADEVRVPTIGETYMVAEREYVGPQDAYRNHVSKLLVAPDNGEGWRGNSDPAVRMYHGWRGTTDDWAVYARGLRRCLAVRRSGKRSQRIMIVFGRDLAKHLS